MKSRHCSKFLQLDSWDVRTGLSELAAHRLAHDNRQVSAAPTEVHARSSYGAAARRSKVEVGYDADVLERVEQPVRFRGHGPSSWTVGCDPRMEPRASRFRLGGQDTAGAAGRGHAPAKGEAVIDSVPAWEHKAPAHGDDDPRRAVTALRSAR
jgi:hypothetical protein